ncbi:MAG: hypothetical protein JWL69_470, partial [Phycisphaerales bacterium]|nr:hypothetical protein [Phycisphaerales bacterium]
MPYRLLAFAMCVVVGVVSCKRDSAPRKAPDEHTDQAAAAPPAEAPAATPTTRPGGGTFSHLQLLRFIKASRRVVTTAGASGHTIDAMPEGFAALAQAPRVDPALKAALDAARMSPDEWADVGEKAWRAWGVAQVDYNAEAPLRQNAAELAAARKRLTSAEAAVNSGFPILSDEERAQRITKAQDEATTAADRAALWAESARRLRTQIAETEDAIESAEGGSTTSAGTGTGGAAPQGTDDPARDQATVPGNGSAPDAPNGPAPANQADPSAVTAAQQ